MGSLGASSDAWACAHCTLENDGGACCTACYADRPGVWTCGACQFPNVPTQELCVTMGCPGRRPADSVVVAPPPPPPPAPSASSEERDDVEEALAALCDYVVQHGGAISPLATKTGVPGLEAFYAGTADGPRFKAAIKNRGGIRRLLDQRPSGPLRFDASGVKADQHRIRSGSNADAIAEAEAVAAPPPPGQPAAVPSTAAVQPTTTNAGASSAVAPVPPPPSGQTSSQSSIGASTAPPAGATNVYRFDGYITRTGPYGFARTSTGDKLYIAFRSLGIAPMAMDLHVTGEYKAYATPHYKNGATGTVTRISEYREVDEGLGDSIAKLEAALEALRAADAPGSTATAAATAAQREASARTALLATLEANVALKAVLTRQLPVRPASTRAGYLKTIEEVIGPRPRGRTWKDECAAALSRTQRLDRNGLWEPSADAPPHSPAVG